MNCTDTIKFNNPTNFFNTIPSNTNIATNAIDFTINSYNAIYFNSVSNFNNSAVSIASNVFRGRFGLRRRLFESTAQSTRHQQQSEFRPL